MENSMNEPAQTNTKNEFLQLTVLDFCTRGESTVKRKTRTDHKLMQLSFDVVNIFFYQF